MTGVGLDGSILVRPMAKVYFVFYLGYLTGVVPDGSILVRPIAKVYFVFYLGCLLRQVWVHPAR